MITTFASNQQNLLSYFVKPILDNSTFNCAGKEWVCKVNAGKMTTFIKFNKDNAIISTTLNSKPSISISGSLPALFEFIANKSITCAVKLFLLRKIRVKGNLVRSFALLKIFGVLK